MDKVLGFTVRVDSLGFRAPVSKHKRRRLP